MSVVLIAAGILLCLILSSFFSESEKTKFWHYQALNVNRCKGFSSEFKGSKVDFKGGNYHLATFT